MVALTLFLRQGDGFAQSTDKGCLLESVPGTSRRVLHCDRGLTITVEGGARYRLLDRNGDGSTDGVALNRKAVLIDAPSSAALRGFEVVTPQAIAAVRGTRWAVDVARGKTSVFVVRGAVAVRRPSSGNSVVLGPGEGVDVDTGTVPLEVRRWPVARRDALLRRLGQ
uniref:FecR domain-containing protein n=1 Tax=Mesorhizobium sp. L-8-3 TaxID=2744522 RepID=UPI001FD38AE6|nr:FecR domain-containing protein [Mesorhizobium sp. L-8-3]